jgi:hypothetical protein
LHQRWGYTRLPDRPTEILRQGLKERLVENVTRTLGISASKRDSSMDWFESLTGFRETGYEDTRAKLKVEGRRLRSLINGKSYGIGELELVSLQALRERVKGGRALPGRLKVSVVRGDVRQMHQAPENAGALFQVASQFNLLEMVSPQVTPEDGTSTTKPRARHAPSLPARLRSIATISPRWAAAMARPPNASSMA